MAMNWIKFDTSTPDKPEVWSIATDLQIDPDAVVGKLLRIWTWFDDQSEQGNAPTVTKALLDRKVCVTGFCDAVIRAGWMVESGGLITLPNFERHNGQTAKTRAQTAKRVAHCKKSNAVGNAKVTVGALPKEEKSIRAPTLNKPIEIDAWEIPDRLNTGEVRELLQEFEDMRRATKRPIKSKRRASKILDQFDDVDHLIYALTTCIGNEYQGLKPEYRKPANGKPGKQPINLDEFVIK